VPGLGFADLKDVFATVTFDADFDALPAAASVSSTWKALSIYGTADACAQRSTTTPTFFAASPVAVMDTCAVDYGCTNIIYGVSFASGWGATFVEGCLTVTPQTSGYMMVSQWTGGDPQQVL
jgi:hypothetical protein